jgi:ABC-type amino acid transport substrate-binding protein
MRSAAILLLAALAGLPGIAYSQTGVLDRVRQGGVMTIGFIEDAAPFSFAGADRQPQGFAVDLCREVAAGVRAQLKLQKIDVRWVPVTVGNRLEAVRTGKVDIECSTTTWTLSRQNAVDFSLITFVDGGSILSKKGGELVRLFDADGKRIAVMAGTTTERALREALAERSLKSELVTVSSRTEGLKLLDDGKVDGFASDRTTLIGIVARGSGSLAFRLMDEDFSVEQYALSLPRGDYEFRLAVNRVLARLYRSGEIVKIYNRWLGSLGPPSLLLSATYFVQSLGE